MRHHHGDAPRALGRGLDHVADEGIVALALGRNAPVPAVMALLLGIGMIGAPLVEREGRIGHHHLEAHEPVALQQLGIEQGVAPLDARVVHAVQEHIHHAQRPGAAYSLLTVERVVVTADLSSALQQQRAGAAGRVADALTRLRIDELSDQQGDLLRGVELAGLLAGARRESVDQELVGIADDIALTDPRGAQIETRIGEVLQQILEEAVALPGIAEQRLGVEVDVAKDVGQLGLVGQFDLLQGDVDQLAQVGRLTLAVEVVEAALGRQNEPLACQLALDAGLVVAELALVLCVMVLPDIRDVLHEQHDEQIVLVVAGIDGAAKGIAGTPEDSVDLVLLDLAGHWGVVHRSS